MSKVKAFLSKDGTRVASLVVPGFRTLRIDHRTTKFMKSYTTVKVLPCEVHDERTPTVVVDAFQFEEGNYDGRPCGRIRICFLCWSPTNIA